MKKKILIVEDDADTQYLLKVMLRELDVDIVTSNWLLTTSEVETIKPDLILLDYWLRGGLGSDLCDEIKANKATSNMIVIMISAIYNIEKVAIEHCADDYIEKPFDLTQLIGKVAGFLQLKVCES